MKTILKTALFIGTLATATSLFAATDTATKSTDPAASNTTMADHSKDANKTDDVSITKGVKEKIAADKSLHNQVIVVITENGIVTLTGDLETDNQASNAISAARSISGVNDVNTDKLKVKSSHQPFTDTVITGLVKGSFLQNRLFGEGDVPLTTIHVETKNGIVHLTGTAESSAQISKAVELAKAVKNVKNVDAKVEVKK